MENLTRSIYHRGIFLTIITITLISLYTIGCADEPSSLGLNFIPPGETTGVRIFDSYIDTMPITSRNIKYYVNTSGAENVFVGKSGTYDSKMLLKFTDISDAYDSATVLSAKLYLYYKNYYYPNTPSDSLGQISFDVYKIQENYNFSNITLDSISGTAFGNISQGSYMGSPAADSQRIDITLNNSMVRDWLEYAADSSYSQKNYGIVLSPNNSSTCIKGFYTTRSFPGNNVHPKVEIILNKNNRTDTITITSSSYITLTDGDVPISSETFSLQAGISFVQQMIFDVSRLPQTATINDVQLYLTLDTFSINYSNQTNYTVYGQFIKDTAGIKTDLSAFDGNPTGDGRYMIRLVRIGISSPFARWLSGEANYGILLFAGNQTVNLDRYVFYNENATDPLKRPRVIIKYTPRVIP